MIRRLLLYVCVLTIPLLLGLNAWQASRYTQVEKELHELEEKQDEWLDSNKRLIAGIAVLSSTERIEYIAREDLKLEKKTPEEILQIHIVSGRDSDG